MGEADGGLMNEGTAPAGRAEAVLEVARGRATATELAAVAVVLFSLLAARGEDPGALPAPAVPRWRPERQQAAYRSPHSWR